MGIRTKLIACSAVVLAMGAANAVHTSIAVRGIRDRLDAEISASSEALDDLRQITIGIANMRSAMRGITVFSLQNNTAQFAKARSSFDATADEMRKTLEQMAAGNLIPEDRDAVAIIRSGLDQWVVNFRQFSRLCASGRGAEGNEFALRTTTPIMDTLQKTATELGRRSVLRQTNGTNAVKTSI
jgi:hypothetical protein